MASGQVTIIAAGACFLLAALAHVRRWPAGPRLVYTLYWHLRRRRRWRGRRPAWLALVELGAVFFTFLGASWLARTVGLENLHLF